MRLATAVPAIVLEKHHRARESRTGADWELWVGRPGSYLGFRVQAKILNAKLREYSSLYKSRKTSLLQVDKLINAASATSPATYPLYAFYNYWDAPISGNAMWPCPRPDSQPQSAGWTIASAHLVRTLLRAAPSKKLQDLSHLMFPVSCLFCCTCTRSPPAIDTVGLARDVARRVSAFWQEDAPDVVEQAPVYVERMFKNERPDEGWEWLPRIVGVGRARRGLGRHIPAGLSTQYFSLGISIGVCEIRSCETGKGIGACAQVPLDL